MEALTRVLDALAVLLIIAPLVNLVFVQRAILRYRHDPGRSPILLGMLVTLLVVWLLGVLVGVSSVSYLLRPEARATLTSVAFGAALLLLQAIPHFLDYLMRRLERG